MYLWHTIVLDIYSLSPLKNHQLARTILFTWPLIFIASICSYAFIERPFLEIRHGAIISHHSYVQRHPGKFLFISAFALAALTKYLRIIVR